MHVCPCRLHIEGSQLERCISSMICGRDIPFWSETLDIILCLQASNPQLMFMCAPVWNVIWCYRSPILTCGLCVHHRRSYCSEWLLVSNPNLVCLCTSELIVQCGVHFCQCILCNIVCSCRCPTLTSHWDQVTREMCSMVWSHMLNYLTWWGHKA